LIRDVQFDLVERHGGRFCMHVELAKGERRLDGGVRAQLTRRELRGPYRWRQILQGGEVDLVERDVARDLRLGEIEAALEGHRTASTEARADHKGGRRLAGGSQVMQLALQTLQCQRHRRRAAVIGNGQRAVVELEIEDRKAEK
jgi:hypothetical protein